MPQDLSFYYAAVPAVLLVGLAKGGMGDALSLIGLPFLALVVSPVEAAAILLPILVFMDMISLVIWRKHGDWATLKIMLPGAIFGIALGWATSALVPGNMLRIVIGAVTILFCLRYFWNSFGPGASKVIPPRGQRPVAASLWGAFSGYGSFVAHAGGAPFQIYALPLKFQPREYTGTSVRFFAILNAIKLIPYFALGQLDTQNLATSATLLPFAPLATIAGAWCVRRMKPQIFYPFVYAMALIAAFLIVREGLGW
ncbi:sulfite exporter TauE/SafE family protein [Rhizobium leguminosarum]|uniref:sulfite exporter TauE/SafE family protein n=1 Tax=Rhizobium leguminosarum TaxID=384 RepID=UPI00102FF807|nr:sulfite exporter TauE/SafE family protein [Rhizobium leguminosarum]TAX57241.1 sulfite exporter TauE/SafE family protein [Rhizobium leguminosarum]TAX61685.1 sulfite exporter TauE/SafE family protein [Rhizobium leguminosarum]TAY03113.1 sulfite exporter TauE/SafE family protein [Rhizobium leguminosarum]